MDRLSHADRTLIRTAGPDLYRALFRCSSDGLILLDGAGLVLEANAAAGVLVRRPSEALTGRHLVDLIDPQDVTRLDGAVRQARESGSAQLDFSLIRADDGTPRPIAAHLEDVGGSGLLVVLHDITEKSRFLDAVRRERETTRSLLETVNASVLGTDLKGRITVINRKFRETTGVELSTLVGGDAFNALVAPRDRAAARAAHETVLERGIVEEIDLTVRCGEVERMMSFNGALVRDAESAPVGVVWVAVGRHHRPPAHGGRAAAGGADPEEPPAAQGILASQQPDSPGARSGPRVPDVRRGDPRRVELQSRHPDPLRRRVPRLPVVLRGAQPSAEIATFHENKLTNARARDHLPGALPDGQLVLHPARGGMALRRGAQPQALRRHGRLAPGRLPLHPAVRLEPPDRRASCRSTIRSTAVGRRPRASRRWSCSPTRSPTPSRRRSWRRKSRRPPAATSTLVDTMNDGLLHRGPAREDYLREPRAGAPHRLPRGGGRRPAPVVPAPKESVAEFRRRSRLHEGGASALRSEPGVARRRSRIPVLISTHPYVQNNAMVGVSPSCPTFASRSAPRKSGSRMHEEVRRD